MPRAKNRKTTNLYKVGKILEHKIFKEKMHYLVKWENFDDTFNSWEPKENFESIEIIQKYWKSRPITPVSSILVNKFEIKKILTIFEGEEFMIGEVQSTYQNSIFICAEYLKREHNSKYILYLEERYLKNVVP